MTHTELARQMLAQGRPSRAIVAALVARGVKRPTAYTTIFKARQKPKPTIRAAALPRVCAAVDGELRTAIHQEARARGMTTALFTGRLLSAVLRDGLVDAVLDEAAE